MRRREFMLGLGGAAASSTAAFRQSLSEAGFVEGQSVATNFVGRRTGGLLSYGLNIVSSFGVVAEYVDRILRGAKPADLPVQAPVKYELGVNLKAAKALGIVIPPTLLARANEEVIE